MFSFVYYYLTKMANSVTPLKFVTTVNIYKMHLNTFAIFVLCGFFLNTSSITKCSGLFCGFSIFLFPIIVQERHGYKKWKACMLPFLCRRMILLFDFFVKKLILNCLLLFLLSDLTWGIV